MSERILSYSLSLATSAFTGPLRGAQTALSGFGAAVGTITAAAAPLLAVAGGMVSVAAAANILKSSVSKAADQEALETSFRALLKSGAAAKAMVKDLTEFADITPFDPVPVAEAGKQLLAFSFAAKEVKPLLNDIGDLAAAMQKPLTDVANVFGRLKAGDFGEAFERLRDFGISRLDLVGEGLKFDKGGSFLGSASQALDAVRAVIRRKFGGGMADLSSTFRGLFSTMAGYWDGLQRTFGKPIMQALKPVLEDATGILKTWTPIAEQWGEAIGKGVFVVRELFQSGQLWDTAVTALRLAGATFINTVSAGLQGAIAGLVTGLSEAAGIFQRVLGESGLWEGIGYKMQSVFFGLKATLLETFASVIESLPEWLGGGISNATPLRTGAGAAKGEGTLANIRGDRALSTLDLRGLVAEMAKGFSNTKAAAVAGYQNAGELIPTGAMLGNLENQLAPMLAKADAFFSQQNREVQAATAAKETAKSLSKKSEWLKIARPGKI
jgi:hypothetical protein